MKPVPEKPQQKFIVSRWMILQIGYLVLSENLRFDKHSRNQRLAYVKNAKQSIWI